MRIIKRISRERGELSVLPREIRLMKNLNHPHIPAVYDVELDKEAAYIVEQYIEGQSLGDLCKYNLLSTEELFHYFFQIASLIKYLHSFGKGVLYLDLKPSNIIVSGDNVYLIDFGSAVEVGRACSEYTGTIGFCAPEQISGAGVSTASDIYSLGRVLKFMLDNSSTDKHLRKSIVKVISRCCAEKQRMRPSDAEIPIKMMQKILKSTQGKTVIQKKQETKVKSDIGTRIGVFGIGPGVGVTHIARCIESSLKSITGSEVSFSAENPELYDREGYDYYIFDLGHSGASLKQLMWCDVRIIVGPAAEWKKAEYNLLTDMAKAGADMSKYRVFVNLCDAVQESIADILEEAGVTEYSPFPYEPLPYSAGEQTKKMIWRQL